MHPPVSITHYNSIFISQMSIKELSAISKNIRKQRKKLKLSQGKLFNLAGVAYNTVVKIESGENPNPTIETLFKIANALNVSVEELL